MKQPFGGYIRSRIHVGLVSAASSENSSSEPSSSVGSDGSGSSQPNSLASPWYWIWMCAVTCPFLTANRMRSPACTTGTDGSGGVKQPQADATDGSTAAAPANPQSNPSFVNPCIVVLLD